MGPLNRHLLLDVVDATSLAATGPGPVYNVISAEVTEEIDRAGVLSVVVPANDERARELLGTEAVVRIRASDGFTAYGRLQQIALSAGIKPDWTLSGQDLLGELLYPSTGPAAEYNNVATASIIANLLSGSTFTSGTVTPSVTPTTIRFEGQTVLQALTALAEQVGDHFRQGGTPRTLDWGIFGGTAVWRFTNVYAYPSANDYQGGVSYVDHLELADVSGQIENRLFPTGVSGFDLRDASSTATGIKVMAARGGNGVATTAASPITAGTNTVVVTSATGLVAGKTLWIGTASNWAANHEYAIIANVVGNTVTLSTNFTNNYSAGVNVIQDPLFYIEDSTSQATYGVRENTPQFPWIGPLSNSATDLRRAADVLYQAAQARLLRYKLPYKSYVLSNVLGIPPTLRVGNAVRVVFRGAPTQFTNLYENIDANFYVTKIIRRSTTDGRCSAQVEIADTSRPTPNNERFVIFNLDTLRWIIPTSGRGTFGITGGGTLTLTSNTTIDGGGTISLGGAALTIPASGTVALGTGSTNALAYWSGTNTLTYLANSAGYLKNNGSGSLAWYDVTKLLAG